MRAAWMTALLLLTGCDVKLDQADGGVLRLRKSDVVYCGTTTLASTEAEVVERTGSCMRSGYCYGVGGFKWRVTCRGTRPEKWSVRQIQDRKICELVDGGSAAAAPAWRVESVLLSHGRCG